MKLEHEWREEVDRLRRDLMLHKRRGDEYAAKLKRANAEIERLITRLKAAEERR